MADLPENPNPTRKAQDGTRVKIHENESPGPSNEDNISDLQPERRKTIRDYLGAQTSGDPEGGSVGGSAAGKGNFYPIDTQFDRFVNNGVDEEGRPVPLSDSTDQGGQVVAAQSRFIFQSEAIAIMKSISNGSFFEENQALGLRDSIVGDDSAESAGKNGQKFGHVYTEKDNVKLVSQEVSTVLLSNRFTLPGGDTGGTESNTKFKFRSTPTTDGVLAESTTQKAFDEANQNSQAYYYDKVSPAPAEPRRRDLPDGAKTPVPNLPKKMQQLGVEAVLAGSGFKGVTNPQTDSTAGGLDGFWETAFDLFEIEKVLGGNASGVGLDVKSDLRDGTKRVWDKATQPSPEWLMRDDQPDFDLKYVNANGQESETPEGDENNFAYTVMNNMITKFIADELFLSRQYLNSLTFQAAIFVDNILAAVIFDALLFVEHLPGVISQDGQYLNLMGQYNQKPWGSDQTRKGQGLQLRKGRARGAAIPASELRTPTKLAKATEGAMDILELFGIPNLADLLSGPILVQFVLDLMGVNKALNTRTDLRIGSFKIGDFLSFTPAYLIGSLQTTISALKDPMSQGFFFNLGRQIARRSSLQQMYAESSGENGFIDAMLNLRHQSSFRYFITMVNLGDNAVGQFFSQAQHEELSLANPILSETFVSTRGLSEVNPASVRNTPSIFLIPKSFQMMRGKVFNGTPDAMGLGHYSGVTVDDAYPMDQFFNYKYDTNRLQDSIVDKIERILEAEYMPFYIKDMRTNEIISFHAFLDSLTDGFTSTYTKTTGMGRIEPVMTYENASRSISVGFTMVAFSPEDMDMLYWKLNKLVTLMYPQFSKGTMMQGADKRKFYMPFSQIPTASPMVRLRVGDVLTSNYSDASAARLLGVGDSVVDGADDEKALLRPAKADEPTGGFPLPIMSQDPPTRRAPVNYSSGAKSHKKKFLKGLVKGVTSPVGPTLLSTNTSGLLKVGDTVAFSTGKVKVSYGKVITPSVGALGIPAAIKSTGGLFKPKQLATLGELEGEADGFEVLGFEAPESAFGEDPPEGEIDKVSVWLIHKSAGADPETTTQVRDYTVNRVYKESKNSPDGLCFSVAIMDITNVTTTGELDKDSLEFIRNNTITQAFMNARGEGLAGFIDNFQIDWQLNQLMWDTTPGKRAPQGCKITLGFQPIHDITPGIDADGLNRAPVYKVGSYSRELHKAGLLRKFGGETASAVDPSGTVTATSDVDNAQTDPES